MCGDVCLFLFPPIIPFIYIFSFFVPLLLYIGPFAQDVISLSPKIWFIGTDGLTDKQTITLLDLYLFHFLLRSLYISPLIVYFMGLPETRGGRTIIHRVIISLNIKSLEHFPPSPLPVLLITKCFLVPDWCCQSSFDARSKNFWHLQRHKSLDKLGNIKTHVFILNFLSLLLYSLD